MSELAADNSRLRVKESKLCARRGMSNLAAENAALRAQNADLLARNAWLCGEGLGEADILQNIFGLTPTISRILMMLLRRGFLSKQQAWTGLYGDRPGADMPDDLKIVEVHMCKLRKRIRTARRAGGFIGAEIEIETIWGRGWRLTPASTDIIRGLINAESDYPTHQTEETAA
jgi:DNA-binding response OmpR family regulator